MLKTVRHDNPGDAVPQSENQALGNEIFSRHINRR
jgi:hypothetical protein